MNEFFTQAHPSRGDNNFNCAYFKTENSAFDPTDRTYDQTMTEHHSLALPRMNLKFTVHPSSVNQSAILQYNLTRGLYRLYVVHEFCSPFSSSKTRTLSAFCQHHPTPQDRHHFPPQPKNPKKENSFPTITSRRFTHHVFEKERQNFPHQLLSTDTNLHSLISAFKLRSQPLSRLSSTDIHANRHPSSFTLLNRVSLNFSSPAARTSPLHNIV